jgi:acyl dehydratase
MLTIIVSGNLGRKAVQLRLDDKPIYDLYHSARRRPSSVEAAREAETMKVIRSIEEAQALAGHELGVSDWLAIDQQRVNDFADVTGDHQWIHVDVERAKAESPYKTPIAHGFLTLSLIPALSKSNFRLENAKLAINYGLNKVRFLNAVPVGASIRLRSELADAAAKGDAVDLTITHTIEIDGADKPAAVAEMIVRAVF